MAFFEKTWLNLSVYKKISSFSFWFFSISTFQWIRQINCILLFLCSYKKKQKVKLKGWTFSKGKPISDLTIDFETRITTCLTIHALLHYCLVIRKGSQPIRHNNFEKNPDVLFIAAMGHEIYVPRQMKYSHNYFRDKWEKVNISLCKLVLKCPCQGTRTITFGPCT